MKTITYTKRGNLSNSHRFTSDKGQISLIQPTYYTGDSFEIYCLEGGLFEDVERYDTFDQAMARITSLLT